MDQLSKPLRLEFLRVENLRNTDKYHIHGKIDPYIEARLGDQYGKTATKNNAGNAEIGEFLIYKYIPNGPSDLNIKVMDSDLGYDDIIGEADIDVHSLASVGDRPMRVPIFYNGTPSGIIIMRALWPQGRPVSSSNSYSYNYNNNSPQVYSPVVSFATDKYHHTASHHGSPQHSTTSYYPSQNFKPTVNRTSTITTNYDKYLVNSHVPQIVSRSNDHRVISTSPSYRPSVNSSAMNSISSAGDGYVYINGVRREGNLLPDEIIEEVVRIAVPRTVEEIIEVPQYQTVERVVEVPKVVQQERIVEVPKIVHQERVVEVPQVQIIEKIVEVPQIQTVERVINVPKVVTRENIVEVPKIVTTERLVEVPQYRRRIHRKRFEHHEELNRIQKHVPKIITEEVVRHVDVPQIQVVERVVEVPQIQEHIREVPKIVTEEVIREVPVIKIQEVLKHVEVPQIHVVDRHVEVPHHQEVVKHVPGPVEYIDIYDEDNRNYISSSRNYLYSSNAGSPRYQNSQYPSTYNTSHTYMQHGGNCLNPHASHGSSNVYNHLQENFGQYGQVEAI